MTETAVLSFPDELTHQKHNSSQWSVQQWPAMGRTEYLSVVPKGHDNQSHLTAC